MARIISGLTLLAFTGLTAFDAKRAVEGWNGVGEGGGVTTVWIGVAIWFWFLSYAVTTAVGRDWGQRPLIVAAVGAGLAVVAGWAVTGSAWGPIPAAYLLIVATAVGLVISVGFIVQSVLATPGCEVRAYADLWSRLTGKPVNERACANPAYRWLDAWEASRMAS